MSLGNFELDLMNKPEHYQGQTVSAISSSNRDYKTGLKFTFVDAIAK